MKKLEKYTDQEWSFVATAITADIIDNKITLNPLVIKQLFIGADAIDAEDLLKALVLPDDNWETYIKEAIEQGKTWPHVEIKFIAGMKDINMFCRACNFEGSSEEFIYDEEGDAYACPECMSLITGVVKEE